MRSSAVSLQMGNHARRRALNMRVTLIGQPKHARYTSETNALYFGILLKLKSIQVNRKERL